MRFLVVFSVVLGVALAGPPPAPAVWLWPVDGEVITPYRNGDDPYAAGMHRGIDIAAPLGTPVVAAEGGTVTFAGIAGSSGLTVAVDTGPLTTSYLHLASTVVRRGHSLTAGDPVGKVGGSGSSRSAGPPHLHFGVRESGTAHGYRDPLPLLGPRAAPRAAPPAEPVGAPAALPEPAAPEPGPAPTPGPRSEPARPPLRVPRAFPAPAPAPVRVPVERPAPVRTVPVQRRVRGARRTPKVRTPGRGPSAQRTRRVRPAARRDRARGQRPPDHSPLPWAVACAGLLLAGGCLGLGRRVRRAASSIDRPCPTTSRRPSTT